MPVVAIAALTAIAIVAALSAPFRWAVLALLGTILLVPDTIHLPGTPGWLPVSRLVLFAFVAGLALRIATREISVDAVRPTRTHLALSAFVVVAFVNGIAIAPEVGRVTSALFYWLNLFDQLLFLFAVVAAARVLGMGEVARQAVALITVVAGIALVEHYTHGSYARFWFHHLPRQLGSVPAEPLETRGGSFRVRGPAQYALEFGWIGTLLFPMVVAVATHARRRIALLAPAALGLAVVWSSSRSALAGMVVGVGVLAAGVIGNRRTAFIMLAGAAIAAGLYAWQPSISRPFRAARTSDSNEARQRQRVLTTRAAQRRPYTGLGFNGLSPLGSQDVDASYLRFYSAIGVLGLVALAVPLTAGTGAAVSGTLRSSGPDRVLAAGVAGGVVAGLVGAAAYAQFSNPASAWTFWLVVGLGVTAADVSRAETVPLRWPSPFRVMWPAAGLVIGSGLAAVAPFHVAVTYRFTTLPPAIEAASEADNSFIGRVLLHTACSVIEAPPQHPRSVVSCADPRDGDGAGEVRFEAPSSAALTTTVRLGLGAARAAVPGLTAHQLEPAVGGVPTWARTAPVWVTVLGGAMAILCPPIRPRRRRPTARAPAVPAMARP